MSTHLLSDTASTQAFIGGDFVDAASGATFDSLVPATGQVIVHVAAGASPRPNASDKSRIICTLLIATASRCVMERVGENARSATPKSSH